MNDRSDTAAGLSTQVISQLQESLRGGLLRPGQASYEEARKVWNGMIDRRPALIVRSAGVADVIQAVNFARDYDLPLSVRGGGHNVAGNAVCDDGVMISLERMNSVHVDPQRQTARVEGGALWRDFDHETQAFGLATNGGLVSTTGVAGLTLGGGIGWLLRKYGLSCDNVLSVDVVTAEGKLVTANAEENAELYWGVRGGGGNFGVVTSFVFDLHPVSQVLGGMVIHPLAKAGEILRFFREFTAGAPDELTLVAALMHSPDSAPVIAILCCYCGDLTAGEKVVEPLRTFGPPVAGSIGPIPYVQQQQMLDEGFPAGNQNYWRSNFLNGLSDEAIDTLIASFGNVTSPLSSLVIEQMGGVAGRVDKYATAFMHRDAPYNLLILGMWPDPTEREQHIEWVRGVWQDVQPYTSGGAYVNYLSQIQDEGDARIEDVYGPETYARLAALKKKYDPKNLFRVNQNIKPSA